MASGGRILLPSKKLGEVIPAVFDFTSSMGPVSVESILTRSVFASVYSGVDPTPSTVISGAPTSPTYSTVRQLITGGVPGCIYSLLCTITTNQGQTIQQLGLMAIEIDPVGSP